LPVAGSMWTTGLSALSGLVDKDRRCEALCVRFTADGKADASEGGGGGGGEGGGEASGEAMILYTRTYNNIQNVNFNYIQISTSTVLYVTNLELWGSGVLMLYYCRCVCVCLSLSVSVCLCVCVCVCLAWT